MANVKALCIRGIRSFGPDDGDQQYISFSRPLTLILGQNGCGKTTIIECLRYAVTGQQPPGSRNECFVYDAKVNKTREVMGQAKLKVVNAAGHELTVTRSMQVTSKEKRTQFKTLDGSVERVNARGERTEISSRCADIDHIMQEELGVSKAIINSVIFCHQEDSSWPLEEGKKVKERFDEIFDADKYSDCFDRLKKIRKEYAVRIKLVDQNVIHLTEKKSALDRKKIEVINTERRIEEAELKSAELSRELRPVIEKIKAIEVIQKNLVEFENKKNKANTRLEHCLNQQNELRKAIKKIFEGSDAELKRSIDSYESEALARQRYLTEQISLRDRLVEDAERAAREEGANEVKFNGLMMMEGQQQERIALRASVIADAARDADVEVPEDLETNAALATTALSLESRERGARLAQLRTETDDEERELQQAVDECRAALVRHEQTIESKRGALEAARRELADTRRAAADADRCRARLDLLDTQLATATREYEAATSELDGDRCQSEISEQERVLERMDAEAETLSDTMARLQQKSVKLAEKKALEESLAGKEKALSVLKNKHRAALLELLQRIPERGFALAVSEVECSMNTEVDSVTKQLKDKQNQVTKLESERCHVRSLLTEARASLTSAEEQVYQACPQGYEPTVAKVDAAVTELREEQNTLQSSVFIINKYKRQLQDGGGCPLCNRGFDSQAEVVQLISDLTTKIINVPARLERVSEELSRQTARRDELVKLGPLQDKMAALKDTTIPQLERRLAELDKNLSETREAEEEASMTLAEPARRLATARQLASDMPLLDRYTHEIEAANKDLRSLNDQLGAAGSDPSPETAAARQKELRHNISMLRANVKSKQAALNAHTKKLQAAANKKNKIKEELLEVQKKSQELVSLPAGVARLEAEAARGEGELAALQADAPALRTRVQDSQRDKNARVERMRTKLEEARRDLSRLDAALEKIRELDREIEQHEAKNVAQEMARLKAANKLLQEKKKQLQTEMEELAKKIELIKDELAKQEIYKRDLTDNVKLRAAAAEAAACGRELADIAAAASGLDAGALADKEALITRQTDLFSERAQTEGRMKELKSALSSGKAELSRAENTSVEREHRRQSYELSVLRALDRDVRDYAAALDHCLMQFHKDKMRSINLIIREMWRKIYRGNDIDYIEIKTGSADTSGDRRKYEYRVVQCKNGVEIDMRGRCSAGQKVLACLIIRLALAETFSTRFGVLALDEPTTNLDEANIKSLCRALGDAVRERAAQANFMLILITHDREFIEALGNIDKVSHYFEVSRDDDGKSRIKKVKFS